MWHQLDSHARRATTRQPVLLLGLNEINFDYVREYGAGCLPHLNRFAARHGLRRTIAEQRYEELEPWIQWVTIHTGLDYAAHRIFRLGDIVDTDLPQIWEELEARGGLRVGAISPMNARNASRAPAFFMPDPWTRTDVSGTWDLRLLGRAVSILVNDNAHQRMRPTALLALALGASRSVRLRSLHQYLVHLRKSYSRKWERALLLDQVLADCFVSQCLRWRPDFASLFLNAGAHIQHHYMYDSACYRGLNCNRPGSAPSGSDPVLDAYQTYDRILEDVLRSIPRARVVIVTGLSQVPNPRSLHYYRPRDHAVLLARLGVPFERVAPRMSRDFLVTCRGKEEAARAEHQLLSVRASNGVSIFSVDNRGASLFCRISYTDEMPARLRVDFEGGALECFNSEVSLVTTENGIHQRIGFFLDGGLAAGQGPDEIPLTAVHSRLLEACGVTADPTRGIFASSCSSKNP